MHKSHRHTSFCSMKQLTIVTPYEAASCCYCPPHPRWVASPLQVYPQDERGCGLWDVSFMRYHTKTKLLLKAWTGPQFWAWESRTPFDSKS